MTEAHKPIHQEEPKTPEAVNEAVTNFLQVAESVFKDNHALDVAWEDQMFFLYGNEELVQVSKNDLYKGVPGAMDELKKAYEEGGASVLKDRFFAHINNREEIKKVLGKDVVSQAIERISSLEQL